MSKTDEQTQSKQPIVENTTPIEQPVSSPRSKITLPKLSAGWWVGIAILAFFAVAGLCAVGSMATRVALDRENRTVGDRTGNNLGQQRGYGARQEGGLPGSRGGFGSSTTSSNTFRLSGAVTAVDGSTITVAGNGTITKVIVNDETTFSGDDEPAAVNDTIVVAGTKDGDTFTASRIVLQRE